MASPLCALEQRRVNEMKIKFECKHCDAVMYDSEIAKKHLLDYHFYQNFNETAVE